MLVFHLKLHSSRTHFNPGPSATLELEREACRGPCCRSQFFRMFESLQLLESCEDPLLAKANKIWGPPKKIPPILGPSLTPYESGSSRMECEPLSTKSKPCTSLKKILIGYIYLRTAYCNTARENVTGCKSPFGSPILPLQKPECIKCMNTNRPYCT